MRTALLSLALIGCSSENEIIAEDAPIELSEPPEPENPIQEDRVVQVVVPTVDVLFVVDNSSSMGNEQNALQTNFPRFMEYFLTSGMDYHIAMVSTDMQRANHRGKFRQALGYRFIDLETEDPMNVFSAMTSTLGVHIGSVESGRAAAYSALELRAEEITNVGFLRDEADLHIIFVSDDNDQSGGNPINQAEFIDWALSLKGGDASVYMHGIVTPSQGCNGNIPSTAYLTYADVTGGITYSICAQDWAPALDALGVTAAGLKREFFLSRIPVTDPELLLEVSVRTPVEDGDPVTLDFEVCMAGEEEQVPCDVVYNLGRNSIAFLDYLPDPLAEVLATYPMAENFSSTVEEEL